MSEFESIEDELKFMADCSDDRGDSETSLMFVRYLAHIRKLNAELAALKAGQGEAVATIEVIVEGSCKLIDFDGQKAAFKLPAGIHYLYTAPPYSADAVSVPVELLDRATCLNQFVYLDALQELRALLAQPQEVK